MLVDDFISHHGVKGMKWGVRKSSASSTSSHVSQDSKAATEAALKVKTHGAGSLSNHELQSLITRMNLERQLHTMQTQNKFELDRGLNFTKRILKVGKTVEDVRKFLDTPTGKTVKAGFVAAKVAAAAYTGGGSAAAAKGTELAIRKIGSLERV